MNFYTNNHIFLQNVALKTYFNFLPKTKVTDKEEECIYDFYTVKLPNYSLNFKKALIFSENNFEKENVCQFEYNLDLPKNILKFNSNLLKNIDYENIFFEFLPINKKLKLLEDIKNGKIVYSDESIINYY